MKKDIGWLILRFTKRNESSIPGWAGFISQTGELPTRLTVLDYYPVIYQPITEYSTVQECLCVAQKATDEVGQWYVYTTFDLGVCMKAYPLVWNYPQKFDRHIIMIGTFHLAMGYYHMIGKKMEGSGFADVLLETNLVSSGSIHGVLTGKNYSRATHCHKTLLEALHRLMIEVFIQEKENVFASLSESEVYKELVENPSKDSFEKFLSNSTVC